MNVCRGRLALFDVRLMRPGGLKYFVESKVGYAKFLLELLGFLCRGGCARTSSQASVSGHVPFTVYF